MHLKIKRGLQIGLFSAVILASYNNCSSNLQTSTATTTQSSTSISSINASGSLCEDSLIGLFGRGYYPFLKTNCTTCHSNDVDKPQFANSDINVAYKIFMDRGYTKVSDNAVSANHNPPYSGPQNIVAVNELRLQWQQGLTEYNKCQGITDVTQAVDPSQQLSLETSQKTIPAMAVDSSKTISWNLSNDLNVIKVGGVLPKTPNAQFSIQVTRHLTQGGEDYYVFSNPYVYGSSTDVHVKTMYVKINGRLMIFPTTFKFLDSSVRAGSGQNVTGLLSTGGLTAPGAISSADLLSVAFETIEAVILPHPPVPVQISFTGPVVQFVDSTTGSLNLQIQASPDVLDPVTLTIEEDSASFCNAVNSTDEVTLSSQCLPDVYTSMVNAGLGDSANLKIARARSVVGPRYNRYDWDYKMSANAMTFNPGSSSMLNFMVNFSRDIRMETNRILRLKINIASSTATLGTQAIKYIVVKKINNPKPAPGEITFFLLSRDFGVFSNNCIRCHNSVDFNGKYDITDYDLMIKNLVIVPYSTSSKMFQRINTNDPGFLAVKGMPGSGGLTGPEIDLITKWIMSGAKNN